MNTPLTTPDPVTSLPHTKSVLAKNGFQCSLLTLAPGDQTPPRASHDVEEHILFAIEGEVTVRFGDLNTVLEKDQALLIPKGQGYLIAAGPDGCAKILRVDVPPRQESLPHILTIGR